MIAVDIRKQMNAKPFELIGADAGGHGGARGIEICFDGCVGERTHGHAGH